MAIGLKFWDGITDYGLSLRVSICFWDILYDASIRLAQM